MLLINSIVLKKKETNFISDILDIKYDEKRGRHCVTNQSVSAGECLFVEEAFCAIVLPEFALDYCPVCMRRTTSDGEASGDAEFSDELNLEPCATCTSVIYCSRECREKDENVTTTKAVAARRYHHKYECGVLRSLLHNLGIGHLAYRIVSSVSHWDVLVKYAQIEMSQTATTECSFSLPTRDLMNIDYRHCTADDDYEQVFYLMTHEMDTHCDDLFKYTLTSILLGKLFLFVSLKILSVFFFSFQFKSV